MLRELPGNRAASACWATAWAASLAYLAACRTDVDVAVKLLRRGHRRQPGQAANLRGRLVLHIAERTASVRPPRASAFLDALGGGGRLYVPGMDAHSPAQVAITTTSRRTDGAPARRWPRSCAIGPEVRLFVLGGTSTANTIRHARRGRHHGHDGVAEPYVNHIPT